MSKMLSNNSSHKRDPKSDSTSAEIHSLTERLQESETQYQVLFTANPQPMWVFDLNPLQFLAVNEAAIRQYGYSEAEFLSMTLKDIRTPEGAKQLDEELRAENRNLKRNIESLHIRKDGSMVDVEITANDIPFCGKEARLVIANDITERKQLERQFLRAQRMESVGTLAGGIAHDLNNLLSPILMGVDLLRNHNVNSESHQRILESIDQSARRGAHLINQVLFFARGLEGARVPVRMDLIVKEVESIVTNTFPKSIRFKAKVAPKVSMVEGDPTQLTQVLLNLCVNARDAMPSGGKLEVSLQNRKLNAELAPGYDLNPGEFLELTVSDTGHGISAETKERIFDPFYTTKELGQGTGLGLSTALGIVNNHHGALTVESEPDQGSSFSVLLPVRIETTTQNEATSNRENPVSIPHGKGECILLVDDENSVRTITQKALENFGYEVIPAKNGAKAIAAFAGQMDEIDLIITDVMMPVMDGPALASAIRRLAPDIPIIATSGLRLQTNAERATIDTPYFLIKPFSNKELLELVYAALNDRERVS